MAGAAGQIPLSQKQGLHPCSLFILTFASSFPPPRCGATIHRSNLEDDIINIEASDFPRYSALLVVFNQAKKGTAGSHQAYQNEHTYQNHRHLDQILDSNASRNLTRRGGAK